MCLHIRHLFRASNLLLFQCHTLNFALHCNRFYDKSKCEYAAIQVKTLILHFDLRISLQCSLATPLHRFLSHSWELHATQMYARRDNYRIKSGWNSLWLDELLLLLLLLLLMVMLWWFYCLFICSRLPFWTRRHTVVPSPKLIKSFAGINCYIIIMIIITIHHHQNNNEPD